MKKILLSIALLLSINSYAITEKIYSYPIIRVIDGDTVEVKADFLPPPLKPVLSVRIYGVDTPEKSFRAGCKSEAEKGEQATQFTKKMVANSKEQTIAVISWDKYGGRVLGDIILDGQSLRKSLIDNGYAREYFGDKKQSWCN